MSPELHAQNWDPIGEGEKKFCGLLRPGQSRKAKPNYLESLTFLRHRSGCKEMASVSQTFCSSCRTGSQGAKDYDPMYDIAMLYL